MDWEELCQIVRSLVRVGTVMDRDRERHMVRVRFDSEGLQSGWLRVLQHRGTGLHLAPDGGHSHTGAPPAPDHDHTPGSRTEDWMPEAGQAVLCLYLPVFNGDGYVLGAVG